MNVSFISRVEDAENLILPLTVSGADNKARSSSDSVIMISFLFNVKQQSGPERLLGDFVCPQRKHAITFYHDAT